MLVSLLWPESSNTDSDTSILPLRAATPLPPPGQSHVGVVTTHLKWGPEAFRITEPAAAQQKTVLGET